MKQKENTNLPVLSRVGEVGIPVRKLNTIEQKNYRQYAQQVCDKIKKMLYEVREIVLRKYESDNEGKIIAKLAKQYKLEPVIEEANDIFKRMIQVNSESKAIVLNHARKVDKLTVEKDLALAKLKDEKMSVLIEEFNKHYDKIEKDKNFVNPYQGKSVRITFAKEYEYEEGDDDIYENPLLRRPKRNLNIEYPSINPSTIITGGKVESDDFIRSVDIEDELDIIMKEAKDEFSIAELKLESMEQSVQEVMMFDGDRMNEAFQKLLQFRDSVQEKYIQIVKGIDPAILDRGEDK